MKQKNILFITVAIAVMVISVSSCAHNQVVDTCLTGEKYGFWAGLWHGIIAPVDFVVSLFNDKITMYAQNNNGTWYAFGFLLGSGGWGLLGGAGAKRRRRRRD
ncbi:MAG TPA: hypothetical protein VK179_04275 [Bacteroidales bacterium]|nr:hypothetical protein [Bacteroidales bacterium]